MDLQSSSRLDLLYRVQNECGYQWTSKLESMFKDILLSKEMQTEFGTKYQGKFTTELDVSVCTQGAWPTSSVANCRPPVELAPVCDMFKQFYLNSHNGRKLDWRFDLGRADVKVRFSADSIKELSVTPYMVRSRCGALGSRVRAGGCFLRGGHRAHALIRSPFSQMLILLLFNGPSPMLKYKDIAETTNIPLCDLQPAILSLAHPKTKVLLKKPNNNTCSPDDLFKLNDDYTNPARKITVTLIKFKEDIKKEDAERDEEIASLRRHQYGVAPKATRGTRTCLSVLRRSITS